MYISGTPCSSRSPLPAGSEPECAWTFTKPGITNRARPSTTSSAAPR